MITHSVPSGLERSDPASGLTKLERRQQAGDKSPPAPPLLSPPEKTGGEDRGKQPSFTQDVETAERPNCEGLAFLYILLDESGRGACSLRQVA